MALVGQDLSPEPMGPMAMAVRAAMVAAAAMGLQVQMGLTVEMLQAEMRQRLVAMAATAPTAGLAGRAARAGTPVQV